MSDTKAVSLVGNISTGTGRRPGNHIPIKWILKRHSIAAYY